MPIFWTNTGSSSKPGARQDAASSSAPSSEAQSDHVARSAGIVSSAILTSRLTGLAREMVMANKFGAGFSYDAFLLAFRIPGVLRTLFAEGALSSAFVPTFAVALASTDRKQAAQLSNLLATALIVVVGPLCLFGVIFAPQLVWILAPGFAAVPGKFELAVRLTRIMLPFLLLVALAAQAMGILNSCDKFGVPALASTFFNIGSVCFGLALGFWLGPYIGITPIEGMAWGVLFGGTLQLLWQIPSLHRLGFTFRPAFNWSHPGLRQIFRLMGPAILGNAAVQINVTVNTNLASRLSDPLRGPDGPVSWLAYAFRFMQLPLGLFGVAFAAALLPSVSRSAALNNFEQFRKTVSRSLGLVFLLTIPSSLGLIALGRPIIGAIFQSGRFDAYDTKQTAVALSCYAVGLLGYAGSKILNPAFYALSDARTPMYISLISVIVNLAVALLLLNVFHFGFAALALSTSSVAIVSSLCLFESLRRKLGGIEGRYLLDRIARITGASLLMTLAVTAASHFLSGFLTSTRISYLTEIAVCLPLGLLVFTLASQLFQINEIQVAARAFSAAFQRSTLGPHARIRS
ncbi:MAG: murein biosynthesis integral membrane protein MurJ [Acidobacteriaceae bacterium]|nr:murein biosynthesis integral membrane protein MurJ [Acidobacteriaceae bacterium]MBV9781323.1 murein biosynthesis integral membrane protein MurJ [Acidobacteriaceae bacterium]